VKSTAAGPVSAHLRRAISQEMPLPLKSILVKKRGFSDPSSDSNAFPATSIQGHMTSRVPLLYREPRLPSSVPRFLDVDQPMAPQESQLHGSRASLRTISLSKELGTMGFKPRPRVVTGLTSEGLVIESKFHLPDVAFATAADTHGMSGYPKPVLVAPGSSHIIKTREKPSQILIPSSQDIISKQPRKNRKTYELASILPSERNKTSSSTRPVVVSDDRTLVLCLYSTLQ
jgi:hypothetical protein